MTNTVDYLPIANGTGANVESQAQYVTDLGSGGSLQNGYQSGLAKSIQVNKTLRQSSMMTAALANFIANTLNENVLDDGNLASLITLLTSAIQAAPAARLAHGECRLSYVSATSLKLSPLNGSNIIIDGVQCQIPSAGVSAANTGVLVNGASGNLAASTAYYVSLYNNAGTLALAFWAQSTYSHMPDTTAGNIGVEVISSSGTPNSEHTLVGWVYVDSSGHFNDANTSRTVLSWFNRQRKPLIGPGTNNATSVSGSMGELTTVARALFGVWSDDNPVFYLSGFASNSTVTTTNAEVAIDGAAASSGTLSTATSAATNANCAHSAIGSGSLSEGYHYATPFGSVGSGTGTFNVCVSSFILG